MAHSVQRPTNKKERLWQRRELTPAISRCESADGDEPDRLLKKQLSPQAGQKHPDARRAKS